MNQVGAGLCFLVPKWAFDFAQILANRDHAVWFIGIGLDGTFISRDRDELLEEHQVSAVAWVEPKKQPQSDWKLAIHERLSGGAR